MRDARNNNDGGWHLDKRVPLALIIVMVGQVIAGAWWAASINIRLTVAEQWIYDNKSTDRRLSVIEARMTNIEGTLNSIDRKLGPSP